MPLPMSRYHDPAGFGGIHPATRHKRCSSASVRRGSQKVADETCYRCRMLEVRRMTGARDDMDPRTREAFREGRGLEDVLAIGDPDMYSAGNPVQATTTTLKELQVFPQPLQKPNCGSR